MNNSNTIDIRDNPNYISPDEFARLMRESYNRLWLGQEDFEFAHITMDKTMCDTIRSLGYGEGCDIFKDFPKRWA